jgi:prophage tail gpP-like protein
MSALTDFFAKNGRGPRVSIQITPIDKLRNPITINKFLTYQFKSSILIPVDAFSFTFSMPETADSIYDFIKEGDLIRLQVDAPNSGTNTLCTGIIDVVDIETTTDGADVVSIQGRNTLGQLEDQTTVNIQDKPLWGSKITGLIRQHEIAGTFLFATEPGESKLNALLRFVEPLNCLIWGGQKGEIVVGRPNMGQEPVGDIYCDRKSRRSNVMNIKAIRSSTQIPNIILPIWTGQESAENRISPQQAMNNKAEGPNRLRVGGHVVQRAVVVSTPSGSDAQSLSDINAITVGGSNILQAYALREMAKANTQELNVQANVKSHFNDSLTPFLIDQVYKINYPRASVQEKMYLYEVDYTLDAENGPKTSLNFCKLGTIVAGVSLAPATAVFTPATQLGQNG